MSMQFDPARQFLGVGWAFPPCVEADGRTAEALYEQDVHQAIHIILGTNPGERVMRPDFGAGLKAFLFDPINPTTLARLRSRVEDSLVAFEPRIDLLGVRVVPDRSAVSRLQIEIDYRVRATNTIHNLVYPFYLQEGPGR